MRPGDRLASRAVTSRALLLICVLALALPAGAAAQSNPFAPLPQTPQPTETQAPTTLADQNDDLSTWQEVLIFGGAIALIAGISFAILGDAKRRAPVTDDHRTRSAEGDRTGAALRKPPPNKAKARKRAKTQRAARKKNR